MFVDLDRQPCLVAGGGNVAARKVQVLRDFGAKVTVIAPDCSEKIMDMAYNDKMIEIIKRPFMESDCRGYLLVVAATDDKALNHDISEYCKIDNESIKSIVNKSLYKTLKDYDESSFELK